MEQAIEDQQILGWDAAMKGYLSVEWRYMASMGMADNEAAIEGRGMQTVRSVMAACHKYTQDTWRSRNELLHGTQTMEMNQIRETEFAEITNLYNHPELIPAGDRHYCAQPIERLLARAPSTRRRWLRHMRQARTNMLQNDGRQALITQYFRATVTPAIATTGQGV